MPTIKKFIVRESEIIFLSLLLILIFYSTSTVRVLAPVLDNTIVYYFRTAEEFVILFIVLSCLYFNKSIRLKSYVPFIITMVYFGIITIYLDQDQDYFKASYFWFLHYIAAINILPKIDNRKLFYFLLIYTSILAVFYYLFVSSSAQILDYGVGANRGNAEEAGMVINANTVSSMMVGLTLIINILKHYIVLKKREIVSIYALNIFIFLIILVNASVSSFIFFSIFLSWDLYRSFGKKAIILISAIIAIPILVLSTNVEINVISRLLSRNYFEDTRIINMTSSLSFFINNPYFGVGLDNLSSYQWYEFRTIDHNFYTKLLGSHGIVGFCIFMNYFYSLLSHRYTHFSGLRSLQLFFVYFILFAPPGPCMVLVASFIYYFDTQFYPNKKLNRPINMVVKSESYLKT